MSKIIKQSLPKQIADIIEMKIKNDEYKIGDKLPTEPELVSMFGVSRNTVREAIQSLTNSGLLESRQGDGTYVVAKERLQVEFFNFMNATTDENILEVRDLLENHIVAFAIDRATPEDIKTIGNYLQLRRDETASIRENTKADLNFHLSIAKAAHNDIIFNIYEYVSDYFNRFIYKATCDKEVDQDLVDDIHEKLYAAIRDKDLSMARTCVSRIIEINAN